MKLHLLVRFSAYGMTTPVAAYRSPASAKRALARRDRLRKKGDSWDYGLMEVPLR